MSEGVFIVMEGLDGCGKSTQTALLKAYLTQSGRAVVCTAEPTEEATGKLLRRVLSGEIPCDPATAAALFAADRVRHNLLPETGIQALLQRGVIVLCDRYYYSSMAYQGAQADPDWVRRLNRENPYIRRPDLCLFLEAPVDVCLSRIRAGRKPDDREIFENRRSLEAIRSQFDRVFASLPDDPVIRIDASGDIPSVFDAIRAAVDAVLPPV